MKEMSKMTQTANIIIEYLEDGNWHSVSEIRSNVLNINPALLKNDNFIYVVLNDLKTKRKLIESGERGKYRKCSPSSNQQFKDSCSIDKKERRQILNGWRDFYNNSINKYQVSLDMTEAEFRKAKWQHELNKEIEKLILNFKLADNQTQNE